MVVVGVFNAQLNYLVKTKQLLEADFLSQSIEPTTAAASFKFVPTQIIPHNFRQKMRYRLTWLPSFSHR